MYKRIIKRNLLINKAPRRMTVAFASSSYGQLRHGRIVVAKSLHLRVKFASTVSSTAAAAVVRRQLLVSVMSLEQTVVLVVEYGREESIEDDLDVRGGDPVLEDRTRVELVKRRSTLERTETDAVGVEGRRL